MSGNGHALIGMWSKYTTRTDLSEVFMRERRESSDRYITTMPGVVVDGPELPRAVLETWEPTGGARAV